MRKENIILSIPVVWGIRNVIKSGLYKSLEKQFNVYLAVPQGGVQGMLENGFQEERLLALQTYVPSAIQQFIFQILKDAQSRRRPTPTDKIFGEWQNREQKVRLSAKLLASYLLGHFFQSDQLFYWLEQQYLRGILRNIPQTYYDFIKHVQPVAALSTSYVVNWEWPLFCALQGLNIPTATHVLSFDNLSSRGYMLMQGFDEYYVWQDSMKAELEHFFGIDPNIIHVTGTPQFDFHVQPAYFWDHEQTCNILIIDHQSPYVVYCANHQMHTPNEPELVAFLIDTVKNDDRTMDMQWVIRLHPLDEYSRWASLQQRFPNLVISHPWQHQENATYWGIPTDHELALLGNTLRHAVAVVTIASTIALDSCVVDTPVICVGFHPNTASAENLYYRNVHFTHHYAPITESGAISLVTNVQEFMSALKTAISNRDEKSVARKKLADQICGVVNGRSMERIAKSFSQLTQKNTQVKDG